MFRHPPSDRLEAPVVLARPHHEMSYIPIATNLATQENATCSILALPLSILQRVSWPKLMLFEPKYDGADHMIMFYITPSVYGCLSISFHMTCHMHSSFVPECIHNLIWRQIAEINVESHTLSGYYPRSRASHLAEKRKCASICECIHILIQYQLCQDIIQDRHQFCLHVLSTWDGEYHNPCRIYADATLAVWIFNNTSV